MSVASRPRVFVTAATVAAAIVAGTVVPRHVRAAASVPYHVVQNWPQLPPGEPIGAVSWVDIDAKGVVYAFRRCPMLPACVDGHPRSQDPAGNMWTFTPAGKYVGAFAAGSPKEAHGLSIDRNGFMWTTDVQRHTVKKMRLDGTVLMTLGKDGVPGESSDTFNMPTNTWVAANGDVFVTDGYGNQRMVKFDKNGKFIKAWGSKGPGEGQFRLPHSVVQDKRGRVLVADRCGLTATRCTDGRIEIFDADGKFLTQWKQLRGMNFQPMVVAVSKEDHVYVADAGNQKIWILDGPSGEVLEAIDNVTGAHGMALDADGDIYTANVGGGIKRYSRR